MTKSPMPMPVPMPMATLVAAAQLVSIDTVAVSAKREHAGHVGGELIVPDELSVDVHAHAAYPKVAVVDAASFLCTVKCVWNTGPAGEQLAIATLELSIRLAYAFKSLPVPAEPAMLQRFGLEVAFHHAWPFLRERVRSMSVELSLPPLVLPLRHLNPVRPQG